MRSLPLCGGFGTLTLRSGELAIAADVNEGSRRVPLSPRGDMRVDCCVGVVGRDPFCNDGERGGGGRPPSPDEASVRRNSTHRREKD